MKTLKSIFNKFENAMVAGTFAEAGEFETAREMLRERKSEDSQLRKRTVKEQRTRLKAN